MNIPPQRLPRRRFLGFAVAAASGAMRAEENAAFVIKDQELFRGQTRRLKITRDGRPVAALLFPTDYPTHFRLKPELHQVCTPSGLPVTGSHEHVFIHHQSIMCGHGRVQVEGDVRVVDFYRQLPFPDPARADRWHAKDRNLHQLGPSGIQRITSARWLCAGGQAVIRLELAWQTREPGREKGDTLAVEERFYRLASEGAANIVDVFSTLKSAPRPLTLLPENDHGYLGVRVHDLLDVEDGGELRDSENRVNATGHFRDPEGAQKAPRWVDCTGRLGLAEAGIALMSHPANPRNEWYAREFGLMIVSAAQSEPVRITPEAPFAFAARFIAHDGPLAAAEADRLHTAFSALTAASLRELF